MSPVGGLLIFAIFPIVFTAWGWRYIIVPIVWPTIKFSFRLMVILIWVGFSVGVTGTGWFYRAFGFGLGDAVYAIAPTPELAQQARWEREDSITPDGDYVPGWRQKRGLPELPHDWAGPVRHTSSPALLLVFGVCIFGVFVVVRFLGRRRTAMNEMGHTPRARQETYDRLQRIMLPPDRPHARKVDLLPMGWTQQEHDDFTSALKHLGFGGKAIKAVQRRVDADTLEERVTQALKYLTKEHNA